MNIVIANRQRTRKINARLLKKIAETLLVEFEIEKAELGINLVSAREMTLVNKTFLKHEGSTDVITFNYANEGRAGSPLLADGAHGVTRPTLHGEVFICVEEAVLQAKIFKTTWQSEIVRYIVHGVLHLLGHDDRRAAARHKMKREENRLWRELSGKFSLAQIARP
jgi:probable rRNA maturation factor